MSVIFTKHKTDKGEYVGESFEGDGLSGFYSIVKDKKIAYLSYLKDCDYPHYKEYNTIRPCIYIYRNSKSGKNYVGQAKNIYDRNVSHWTKKNEDTDYERFDDAKFDEIIVFRGDLLKYYFSVDYLEKVFIGYFGEESTEYENNEDKSKLIPVINTNNNKKGNDVPYSFIGRDEINEQIIAPIWEEVLYGHYSWVNNSSCSKIREELLNRNSLFNDPTEDQKIIINEIVQNIVYDDEKKNYVINGSAGTGKTLIVSFLVKQLYEKISAGDLSNDTKIRVIYDPNLVDLQKAAFSSGGLDDSIAMRSKDLIDESLNMYDQDLGLSLCMMLFKVFVHQIYLEMNFID